MQLTAGRAAAESPRGSTRRIQLLLGILPATLFVLIPTTAGAADSSDAAIPAFSGSAAGYGVQAVTTIPNAPLTNTPVDSGGPTAQVAVNSIGSSTGYAAFPDPGQAVVTLPGTVAGLAGAPVSPPSYPFYVQSDANSSPRASAGAGPYNLAATSDATSSHASANAGLATSEVGNASLVTSTASLVASSAQVVASAQNDVQALAVGPLTIGEIKTTATESLVAGVITPSTSMQISGVQVGGVPVAISPAGLAVAGESVPLPLNSTLSSLLQQSGIAVKVLGSQTFSGTVVSPAMQITVPVPAVEAFGSGTFTMTLGMATASMASAVPVAGGLDSNVPSGLGDTSATGAPTGASSALPEVPAGGTALSSLPSLAPTSSNNNGGSTATASLAPQLRNAVNVPSSLQLWDVRSLYLVCTSGAIAAFLVGQLLRRLGVRRPWTYFAG